MAVMSDRSYELLSGFLFGNPEDRLMQIAQRRTAIQDYLSIFRETGLDPKKAEDRKAAQYIVQDAQKSHK